MLNDLYFLSYVYLCTNWKNIKRTPKNQKFENLRTTRKFYFGLGPKRYLGRRDPIESMGKGGGGLLNQLNTFTYILKKNGIQDTITQEYIFV